MKTTVLLISFICVFSSLVLAGDDWRIATFDRSHDLLTKYLKQERELLVAIDPTVEKFYDSYTPYYEADFKMRKYVFVWQLGSSPQSIDWNYPASWGSLTSAEADELASRDSGYRELRNHFLLQKEILRGAKEATHHRNRIYNEYAEEFRKIEDILHSELMLLKDEALSKMANKSQERTE